VPAKNYRCQEGGAIGGDLSTKEQAQGLQAWPQESSGGECGNPGLAPSDSCHLPSTGPGQQGEGPSGHHEERHAQVAWSSQPLPLSPDQCKARPRLGLPICFGLHLLKQILCSSQVIHTHRLWS
jgi:hypothetical protein